MAGAAKAVVVVVAALEVFSSPGSAVVVKVVVVVFLKVTGRLGRFDPDFDLVMMAVLSDGEAEEDGRGEEEEGRGDGTEETEEEGRGEEDEGAEEPWVAGTLSSSFTRAALPSLAYVNVRAKQA